MLYQSECMELRLSDEERSQQHQCERFAGASAATVLDALSVGSGAIYPVTAREPLELPYP